MKEQLAKFLLVFFFFTWKAFEYISKSNSTHMLLVNAVMQFDRTAMECAMKYPL